MVHKEPAAAVSLARGLRARLDDFLTGLVPRYEQEIAEYGDRVVPREEILAASRAQVTFFLDALEAGRRLTKDERAASRALGARRAAEGLPLDALVRAFQLGGRVLWENLTLEAQRLGTVSPEDLYGLAADVFEFVNQMSNEVAAGYRDHLTEQDVARERGRTEVAIALLRGDQSEQPSLAMRMRSFGFPADGWFAVGALGAGSGGVPRTAEPRLRAFCRERLGVDALTAVLESGTAVIFHLAGPDRIETLRTWSGSGTLLTVGEPVEGVRLIPASLSQALSVARAMRARGREGVVLYRDVLLDVALSADEEATDALTEAMLAPLVAGGGSSSEDLVATLEAFLGSGRNPGRTAERLGVHRNTVAYRLRRIQQRLGRSLDDEHLALQLQLALYWRRSRFSEKGSVLKHREPRLPPAPVASAGE